jgi:putative SOS response-associated peptidase YedK
MCVCFSFFTPQEELKIQFSIDWVQGYQFAYNIAPASDITVIVPHDEKRIMTTMR